MCYDFESGEYDNEPFWKFFKFLYRVKNEKYKTNEVERTVSSYPYKRGTR